MNHPTLRGLSLACAAWLSASAHAEPDIDPALPTYQARDVTIPADARRYLERDSAVGRAFTAGKAKDELGRFPSVTMPSRLIR